MRVCEPSPAWSQGNIILCIVDISFFIAALKKSIKELEEIFLKVVKAVLVDCESVDIKDIKTYITLIPVLMKPEHLPFLTVNELAFAQATSVVEIFTKLNLYWDFMNYGILAHLVEKCGCNSTKQLMGQFVCSMEDFMSATKLADFMHVWTGRKAVPQGFTELIVHHGLDPKQTTLQQVENFRKEFCQHFSLYQVVLIFRSVHPGSVTAVWLIPSCLEEHLSTEMNNSVILNVLKQYKILEMLINGVRVPFGMPGKDEGDKVDSELSCIYHY